uniref:Centrosomal protein 120 n=1 Tax=Hippocampus comes TaxID=109280 RepID=A0A3Q2Z032_HIPCM
MARKSEQLLIVLSILEGRDFPKCPRLSLEVQASFDGEQLTTDPVEHLDQPRFSTELAWELDRKMLHQHRLQRTPIKIQCFAVDSSSDSRDNVGYIVLDLRSVQEVPQNPRWHTLLSSKYTKKKPSLLLSMVLENDGKATLPPPPPTAPRAPREKKPLPDKLEAVLVPERGYHQVGPDDVASDMFVLSVTVAFAAKLEQLIPSTLELSSEDAGFFFFYTLLGNDITSEPFRNVLAPDFQPERASLRIRSSAGAVRAFLSQQPPLQIHLCCGTRSLGSADVPLAALAGLPVSGRRRRPPTRSPTSCVRQTRSRSLRVRPGATAPLPPPSSAPPKRPSRRARIASVSLWISAASDRPASRAPWPRPSGGHDSARFAVVSPRIKKYTFAELSPVSYVPARYSYEFFGSAAPVMTGRPVELRRDADVSLPHSYCAFDFAALPQQLQDTFLRVPLVLELWQRDADGATALPIGRASLQLSRLLAAERSRHPAGVREAAWRQSHRDRVPFFSTLSSNEKVAELSFVATLDDFGLVNAADLPVCDSAPKEEAGALPAEPPEMECSRLEEQLQKTLSDLETKEKNLVEAELKVLLLFSDLGQKEAQETVKRLQLECDHRVALERDKARLMEEERTRLLKQITDSENRYKQLEKDFHHFREQQSVKPQARLQSEINILTLEKVELERKLESTTKSKLHYKQQWGRALKELARFKQREQENAVMRLKKQQAELDAVRLRYVAAEEKEAVRQERRELGDIRNRLNGLKQQQGGVGPASSAPPPGVSHSAEEHLSRLLEERDTLLRTGVYGHDDRIIAELDRQIGDAMADAS